MKSLKKSLLMLGMLTSVYQMVEAKENYYDLLGVKPNASIAEITNGYKQASPKAHPNAGGSKDKFNTVNMAYKTLKDNDLRDAYNKQEGIKVECPLNTDVQIVLYTALTGVDDATAKKELLNDTRTKKGHLAKANAMAHKFLDGSVNFLVAHKVALTVGIAGARQLLSNTIPSLKKETSLDSRGFQRAMDLFQVIVNEATNYDDAKKAKDKKSMDTAMTNVCLQLLTFLDLLSPLAESDPKEASVFDNVFTQSSKTTIPTSTQYREESKVVVPPTQTQQQRVSSTVVLRPAIIEKPTVTQQQKEIVRPTENSIPAAPSYADYEAYTKKSVEQIGQKRKGEEPKIVVQPTQQQRVKPAIAPRPAIIGKPAIAPQQQKEIVRPTASSIPAAPSYADYEAYTKKSAEQIGQKRQREQSATQQSTSQASVEHSTNTTVRPAFLNDIQNSPKLRKITSQSVAAQSLPKEFSLQDKLAKRREAMREDADENVTHENAVKSTMTSNVHQQQVIHTQTQGEKPQAKKQNEVKPTNIASGGRDDLLQQIRDGKVLNKTVVEKKAEEIKKPSETKGFAQSLSNAVQYIPKSSKNNLDGGNALVKDSEWEE